jgi:hypothetical protein
MWLIVCLISIPDATPKVMLPERVFWGKATAVQSPAAGAKDRCLLVYPIPDHEGLRFFGASDAVFFTIRRISRD